MNRTALYRHYDASGALLYVGIATHHLRRLAAHMRVSDWSDQIATVTIEQFPTRDEAHAAERAAIRTERPRYNRVAYAEARTASRFRCISRPASSASIRPMIEKAIEASGSQAQLARMVGCSQQLISQILAGSNITAEMALAMEQATDGTVSRHELRPDIFGLATPAPQPAQKMAESP